MICNNFIIKLSVWVQQTTFTPGKTKQPKKKKKKTTPGKFVLTNAFYYFHSPSIHAFEFTDFFKY